MLNASHGFQVSGFRFRVGCRIFTSGAARMKLPEAKHRTAIPPINRVLHSMSVSSVQRSGVQSRGESLFLNTEHSKIKLYQVSATSRLAAFQSSSLPDTRHLTPEASVQFPSAAYRPRRTRFTFFSAVANASSALLRPRSASCRAG